MNSSTTISAELGLRLMVPEREPVPLSADVHYRASDPYAVRMAFHAGGEEPVEWIFARELLTVGLVRPIGDGDVAVWPAPMSPPAAGSDARTLNIALSSPFGQALFEAPLAPIADFLRRSYEIVQAGTETNFIDMEGELDELLWSS